MSKDKKDLAMKILDMIGNQEEDANGEFVLSDGELLDSIYLYCKGVLKEHADKESITEEERTEVYVYLTRLRVSENAPNMMGAAMYLQEEFGFDKYTARDLAADWRKWFSEQPDEIIRKIEEKKDEEVDEDTLPERKY